MSTGALRKLAVMMKKRDESRRDVLSSLKILQKGRVEGPRVASLSLVVVVRRAAEVNRKQKMRNENRLFANVSIAACWMDLFCSRDV
jgi:hypothetical protein